MILTFNLGHRPPFSCKNTYGMPSSHMTVIVAVAFFIITKKYNLWAKIGMIILCVLQGIARVELHYHTYEQVFAGVLFGSGFGFFFFKLFDLIWPRVKSFIPKFLKIEDDLYE